MYWVFDIFFLNKKFLVDYIFWDCYVVLEVVVRGEYCCFEIYFYELVIILDVIEFFFCRVVVEVLEGFIFKNLCFCY